MSYLKKGLLGCVVIVFGLFVFIIMGVIKTKSVERERLDVAELVVDAEPSDYFYIETLIQEPAGLEIEYKVVRYLFRGYLKEVLCRTEEGYVRLMNEVGGFDEH